MLTWRPRLLVIVRITVLATALVDITLATPAAAVRTAAAGIRLTEVAADILSATDLRAGMYRAGATVHLEAILQVVLMDRQVRIQRARSAMAA